MNLITRQCALRGCEKTWRTVEESPNHFHGEACARVASKMEPGTRERKLAELYFTAKGQRPGQKVFGMKDGERGTMVCSDRESIGDPDRTKMERAEIHGEIGFLVKDGFEF